MTVVLKLSFFGLIWIPVEDMDEEHIHLQLVAHPNQEDTPTQIMEADEDEDVAQIVEARKSIFVNKMHDITSRGEIYQQPEAENIMNHEEKIVPNLESLERFRQEEEGSQDSVYAGGFPPESKDKEDSIPEDLLVPMKTEDRVSHLEHQMRRSKLKLDGFSQELKILLVEVNIVCEWITENFGKKVNFELIIV